MTTLNDRITTLEAEVESLKQLLKSKVDKVNNVTPSFGTKVHYNKDGLIDGNIELTASDIPNITVDKVSGLKSLLQSLEDLIHSKMNKETGVISNTGTKVNIDSNGNIVSLSYLMVDDIPTLPMTKIAGLSESLNAMKAEINNNTSSAPSTVVLQQTSVTHDNSLDEVLNRLSHVESIIPTLASKSVVKSLINSNDSTYKITPGTFERVTVNSQGHVVYGEKIDVREYLPIDMKDVNGLIYQLNDKANNTDVVTLKESIAKLSMSITGIMNSNQFRNDIASMKSEISMINSRLDMLMKSIDSKATLSQLNDLAKSLELIKTNKVQ